VSPLHDYLRQVREAIAASPGVRVERHREELFTATRANLRIRLRLPDDSFLEISEALVVEEGVLSWISYYAARNNGYTVPRAASFAGNALALASQAATPRTRPRGAGRRPSSDSPPDCAVPERLSPILRTAQ
jgi:hypothetical protein